MRLLSDRYRIGTKNMKRAQKGVVYLWALFAVTVAGVVLAATGQVWQIKTQREKELELLFIGDQFRKAIMSYYNNPLTGVRQYPEKLEDLLEDKRGPVPIRHLRKIYIDPMTRDDEWGVIIEEPPQQQQTTGPQTGAQGAAGQAGLGLNASTAASPVSLAQGIAGVYSLSMQAPRKKAQFPEHFANFSEAKTYQDWHFVFKQQTGTGSTGQQGQQSGSGAAPPASPFGGSGGAGGARSGGGGQNIFGGQGGGGSSGQPPATGQNPFAR